MEEKKAIVKDVIFKKEGIGNYGKWYLFTVSFTNGDVGEYMAKSNPQNEFKVGVDTEYTKEIKTNGNYTSVSIKPKRKSMGGFKQNTKITSLECAVALAVAGKIEVLEIKKFAENFNKYLNEG